MKTQDFLTISTTNDPTWIRALEIARSHFKISSNVWSLFKNSWQGSISCPEFLRVLGFSGLRPSCIFNAANIHRDSENQDATALSQALEVLGIRLSGVVLTINHCCSSVLETSPPILWRSVFREMMTYVEIGTKLGSHVSSVSPAGGALMGFTKGAGLAVLMAHDPAGFAKWHSLTKGYEGRDLLIQTFGCEAYQVAACTVQQLGFGSELAISASLATGQLDTKFIQIDPEILRWKAAYQWIEALRTGRGYPADPAMRSFFPEITPPREHGGKNTRLEVLYTEVAKLRRDGSNLTWHLPRGAYDDGAP